MEYKPLTQLVSRGDMEEKKCLSNQKQPREMSWREFEKSVSESHRAALDNASKVNERIERLRDEIRSTKK